MTQQEIIEYNKMCAEFLGFGFTESDSFGNYFYHKPKTNAVCFLEKNAKFHSDWNWIMEVVEAIGELKDPDPKAKWDMKPFHLSIGYKEVSLVIHPQYFMVRFKEDEPPFDYIEADTTKEAVVQAIYQFLTWYKTHK